MKRERHARALSARKTRAQPGAGPRDEAAPGGRLAERLELLPDRPGVYLLKDARGQILYIGKARRLPARVRSYFQGPPDDPRRAALAAQVRDIDYVVTASEDEALVLEANLVRAHAPHYNILLKDDKKYPFIRVGVAQRFARIEITRRILPDGARYFGPYPHVKDLRRVLRALRRFFPLRSCNDRRLQQGGRECLYYFIGHCPAPCTARVEEAAYRATVEELLRFLGGEGETVARRWEARMRALAAELRFEESARLRDDMRRLAVLGQPQQMTALARPDMDAVGLAIRGDHAAAVVFSHRDGRVVRTSKLTVARADLADAAEIMEAVLTRHYQGREDLPPRILCSHWPQNAALLRAWLGRRAGRGTRLMRPQRGAPARFVRAAAENAALLAEESALLAAGKRRRSAAAVLALQEELGLPRPPERIEGYDVSNIQGRMATGAAVLFRDGRPSRSGYRRFRIREVSGPDDFAMLAEILARRVRRLAQSGEDPPDLILIDGGSGQVQRAGEVLRREGWAQIPLVGLAKREEEIFLPGARSGLRLARSSPGLQLLQRVRDEAHRFAVTYHRQLRSRALRDDPLARIPGIGPAKQRALLARFGSLHALRRASREELRRVPGIGERLAAAICDALGGRG